MKVLIFIVLCVRCSSGVIYNLSDDEYGRMPALTRLDPYEECLREPDARYCSARFALVSDTPSPLLNMIEEYSEHTITHFNHSRIFHGLCMKKRCHGVNTSGGQQDQIEACLNHTLWKEYQLKTKIIGEVSCSDEERIIDTGDLVVVVIILVIVTMNVVGTFYDVVFTTGKNCDGMKLLISFSIRRNFRRLIRDPLKEFEPRLHQLKGFNGLRLVCYASNSWIWNFLGRPMFSNGRSMADDDDRTLSMFGVLLAHSMGTSVFVENPLFLEKLYFSPFCQILVNGTLVMQTFFMISGILLVFNFSMYVENHECNWKVLAKGTLMRWLRLTPSYAVVLAFTATWMRHLGSGPLWTTMVNDEVSSCRQYWWWHLIYLNNYLDTSTCLIQSWYLAADMQLFCIGIMVFVFCRSKISRIVVLLVLFVIGTIIPALHTYYQDLNGILLFTPETARGFFVVDDTFNHVYKRGHTNLLGYTTGLVLGYLLYYWNDIGIDVEKYRKYRLLYWCLFPLLLGVVYSGSIFYADGPRYSLLFRTFYAALVKLVFCSILAVIIMGVILKFENLYRSILEWDGWTVPSKLCYSIYLLHVGIVRYLVGIQTSIGKATVVYQMNSFLGVVFLSFVAAYPFWLLVEGPLGQIVKMMFMKNESHSTEEKVEVKSEKINERL